MSAPTTYSNALSTETIKKRELEKKKGGGEETAEREWRASVIPYNTKKAKKKKKTAVNLGRGGSGGLLAFNQQ